MKHNILLIDDDRASVMIYKRILRDLGHNLLSAYSGEEALQLASEFDISVAVLDVCMPGMNGFEVAERLCELSKPRRVPVLFVTGLSGEKSEMYEGYSAGGVDYLLKPVEPIILRSKVQIFCELQDKEKEIDTHLRRIEAQKEQLIQQLDEMRALEDARMESEIRYRSLVTLSPQAILVQVREELVFYNTSAIQLLGSIDEESMSRRPFHTFVAPEDRSRVQEWLEEIIRRGGRSEPIECALVCHDAVQRHIEMHACCILYDDEVGVQMAIQDITDHKLLEDRLRHLSQVDGLTGLQNRRYFDEQIAAEWSRHTRNGKVLSLIMIDLDQFKNYNDNYGHLAGDACLRAAAEVMNGHFLRPSDLVARYGGEEFVVLLPETDEAGALSLAEGLVSKIHALNILHEKNRTHGVATISAGVETQQPTIESSPDQLIKTADDALYQSKQRGGNCATARDAVDTNAAR